MAVTATLYEVLNSGTGMVRVNSSPLTFTGDVWPSTVTVYVEMETPLPPVESGALHCTTAEDSVLDEVS